MVCKFTFINKGIRTIFFVNNQQEELKKVTNGYDIFRIFFVQILNNHYFFGQKESKTLSITHSWGENINKRHEEKGCRVSNKSSSKVMCHSKLTTRSI